MNLTLLEKAVLEDRGVLKPVFEAAWAFPPKTRIEVLEIANKVNSDLGYELFDDLYYPRLVLDMTRVTQAAQSNMMQSR